MSHSANITIHKKSLILYLLYISFTNKTLSRKDTHNNIYAYNDLFKLTLTGL